MASGSMDAEPIPDSKSDKRSDTSRLPVADMRMRSQIKNQESQLWYQLWNQVDSPVWMRVGNQVERQTIDLMQHQVRDQVDTDIERLL
jgi:hypothetical protein